MNVLNLKCCHHYLLLTFHRSIIAVGIDKIRVVELDKDTKIIGG